MEDGSDKPIAFASRSLAPAERKCAQLDKEGLAIVFGVKKFHPYLFGRHFTILSDHKPLQHLFSESRPVPAMASARIQRWALTLSAYSYTISYKPGPDHANADTLSRLPLPEMPSDIRCSWRNDIVDRHPTRFASICQPDPEVDRSRSSVVTSQEDDPARVAIHSG